MNILWVAKGHLNNDYAGVDGGSSIRIPLINKLRKDYDVETTFSTYHLNADLPPSDIKDESIDPVYLQAEATADTFVEDYMTGVNNEGVFESRLSSILAGVEAVVLEVRPSHMYKEAYIQNKIIEEALRQSKKVIAWDQDIWYESIDYRFREHMLLIAPYSRLGKWPGRAIFAPYYWSDIPENYVSPKYDIVYVGNRYEREDIFGLFLSAACTRFNIAVSGDWTIKSHHIVEKYPDVKWIGPTKHCYTYPLIMRGKCTVHFGHERHREYGEITIRPFEAYMSKRVCFVRDTIWPNNIYSKDSCVVFDTISDLIDKLEMFIDGDTAFKDSCFIEQTRCLSPYSLNKFAERFYGWLLWKRFLN